MKRAARLAMGLALLALVEGCGPGETLGVGDRDDFLQGPIDQGRRYLLRATQWDQRAQRGREHR